MNKLRQIWGDLRSSFWFMPSLMVIGSIVFAAALIEVDSAGSAPWLNQWPRLFGTGAEGARQMLATLAGLMISVMGITFSMTLLALVLASGQYTLADRTIEASRDRARIERRLSEVREALKAESVVSVKEEEDIVL